MCWSVTTRALCAACGAYVRTFDPEFRPCSDPLTCGRGAGNPVPVTETRQHVALMCQQCHEDGDVTIEPENNGRPRQRTPPPHRRPLVLYEPKTEGK